MKKSQETNSKVIRPFSEKDVMAHFLPLGIAMVSCGSNMCDKAQNTHFFFLDGAPAKNLKRVSSFFLLLCL